ncbi:MULTISPECIES: hypothetical protein [unclassified Polaromonas]|uniref:hypothetical protein n=1 Tax=unclassified Polaromonas TaxID=2638319 RepID=UPI0018C979A5|nr:MULTISPECIES: hypothetical protein [unclassified Polaromonas]MBG6070590.1 LPS O-antigen subunit length determinant protein (WzzB/FepE family) [Polaromonas sp. CG_9.7]MBG6112588.1 LPS O-antigen subunit length determinant protein (WzzB/FepE family) [Polaromonas sp. CG_9.2]MDH6184239.1 LPS O-antigen subunit length determinant protein (WzzB/FepE family) [Polaromonas sp. CG_23.6]
MSFGYIKNKILSPLVCITILAFAAIGAGISYGVLLSFKSRSVVLFDRSISEFRTLQEQVSSVGVFDRYLGDAKIISGGTELRNQIVRSGDWISPIFRFSKKDAKELSGLKDPSNLSDLVGYEISYTSSEPETAREKVDLLADYVSDASLKIQIDNFVTDTLAAKNLLLTAALLERDIEAYNLSLLENRLNDLKRLAASYPIVATASERQIFSIEKNGERYMPLPMQIIAIERERFDIKEKLAKTQRQVEGLPSEESMLVAHGKITQKTNSGKDLAFALIKDIQTRVPTAQKGYELIALLEYENKYSRMVTGAFSPSRFIVSPTLPVMPVRSPLKIIVLFAALGGFLALLWQFSGSIKMLIRQSSVGEMGLNKLTGLAPVLKTS